MHRTFFILLFFFYAPMAFSQVPGLGGGAEAKITPSASSVEPGDYFEVAFTLDLADHYHAYYKNGGVVGAAPAVTWELPDGLTAGELRFPLPSAITTKVAGQEAVLYGYEGKVTFLAEIEAAESLELGSIQTVSGKFDWQECNESGCLPKDQDFSFRIQVGETVSLASAEPVFEAARNAVAGDSSAWGALASEVKNKITLEVIAPEGLVIEEPVYFFSDDGQVDSQAEQAVEIQEGKILIQLERNRGNEALFIEAVEPKESLSGLLVYQSDFGKAGVELSAAMVPDANLSGGGAAATGVIYATDEDRAAGLELYDIDARPEAVLLGGEKEKEVTFFSSLGLVFLGGLILNLMPCVFPVLGLKIMGFVSQAGEDESKIKVHGAVFGLGLLLTMWILAAIIISLKLDWGQQLANPVFLGTMIIIFFLMGLSLYGVFEAGTSMTSVGGELQAKKGYSGSFFSGVLTTLVATPCSGPFLGAVMAFALSQESYFVQFAIFTVFALGIASPYVVLSLFPALIKKLPRPGAWMETFKQVMAFFVFATVVFFMKGYLKLVGEDHFNIFLFALCLIGLGAYIYGRYGSPAIAKTKRLVTGYGLAGLMTFGGIAWAYSTAKPPKAGLAWHEWYPGIMEKSRPKKRIIWLDYTADW